MGNPYCRIPMSGGLVVGLFTCVSAVGVLAPPSQAQCEPVSDPNGPDAVAVFPTNSAVESFGCVNFFDAFFATGGVCIIGS